MGGGATAPRIVAGKRLKSSLSPTNVAGLQVRRRAQSLKTIQKMGVSGSAPPLGSARLRSAPLGALHFFPSKRTSEVCIGPAGTPGRR